jgi:two-component sensor histidine kinase
MHGLETALNDKQLLLREMNHRIKNNLTLVAAMLTLQARRFSDATLKNELASAVNRINNLALVHDRLQLFTASVSQVEAAPHFQELCEMLRSLLPPGVSLTSQCSGSIAGDCVESLTLIANELVTNAAKYAFAGLEGGQIIVGFRQEGAGWRLWVHDNGRGLPAADGTAHEKSFGHHLVGTLASRLNAEIFYKSGEGTKVEVCCGVTG